MTRRWGVWITKPPGEYTGWLGFAAGGKLVPMRFDEEEARRVAARSEFTEAKIVPEDQYELPWNEEERRRAIGQ